MSSEQLRTWLGLAADGSEDSQVRVVDMATGATPVLTGVAELVCGSAQSDVLAFTLGAHDVFLGGAGDDRVAAVDRGVVSGGAGADVVTRLLNGVVLGDAGDDLVEEMTGVSSFDGGDGNDTVEGYSGSGLVLSVERCRRADATEC